MPEILPGQGLHLKGVMDPHMIYIKVREILNDELMNIQLMEEEDENITYQVLLSEYKKL